MQTRGQGVQGLCFELPFGVGVLWDGKSSVGFEEIMAVQKLLVQSQKRELWDGS